jgi:hypothetical protein
MRSFPPSRVRRRIPLIPPTARGAPRGVKRKLLPCMGLSALNRGPARLQGPCHRDATRLT